MKLLSIPLSIVLSAVLTISAFSQASTGLPLHVNVGATSAYTTADGTRYLPDQAWASDLSYGYINGRNSTLGYPIGGTTEDKLYQVQRADLEEYRVGKLANGDYLVVLHFADLVAHHADDTIFDVVIEGNVVLDDFDPFAAAGNSREYATIHRFVAAVDDGFLNIQFSSTKGKPQLAAISVLPYTPGTSPPAPPTALKITPSFETTILNWDDAAATDIAGFNVYRASSASGTFAKLTTQPQPLSRYIDQFDGGIFDPASGTLPSQNEWFYKVTAVDVEGRESALSQAIPSRPLSLDSTSLPTYHLEMAEADLAKLSPDVNDNTRYPAKLTYRGSVYDVEVRYRGQFTRRYAKKSWRVVFNGDSPFPNRTSLDLKSHYDDLTMMRGVLTTQIYKKIGIAPPEANHALLFVNGEYFGLYTDYERVDDDFLARTNRNPDSTIYETLFTNRWNYGDLLKTVDYPLAYEVRTNKHLGYRPIQQLVERINLTPRQFFARSLESVFDVQNYLKYYASVIFTGNTDFTRHNVFFVNDPATDGWEVVPWDPDLTWGNGSGFNLNLSFTASTDVDAGTFGGATVLHGPNILLTQVLGVPQYQVYYCDQLGQLADNTFITQEIYPLIDGYYDSIKVAAHADWRKFGWEDQDAFDASPEKLKTFARERGKFLRERLVAYCPEPQSLLRINEIAADAQTVACDPDEPEGAACYDQWVEIYNPTLEEVDLQGFYLTNDLSNPNMFRFDQSVPVPPGGYKLIWTDSEPWQGPNHTDFSITTDTRTIALVAANGRTVLDQLDIQERKPNGLTQRYPDGSFQSYAINSIEASPETQNRLAATIRTVATVPVEPVADQETKVQVQIFPEIEFLDGVLTYEINGVKQTAPLKRVAYGQFEAVIPAQADRTRVEYYLTVQSFTGEKLSPASANRGVFHGYLVGYKRPLVKINEILVEESSGASSWFEIYNDENFSVDLGGMYLTNDPTEPRKYKIPDELPPVQPGSYIVFFGNGTPNLSDQHTNFVLEDTDGVIALYDRDETFNQAISSHTYISAPSFGSLQLCANNTSIWSITLAPTQGYTNSPACRIMFVPMVIH